MPKPKHKPMTPLEALDRLGKLDRCLFYPPCDAAAKQLVSLGYARPFPSMSIPGRTAHQITPKGRERWDKLQQQGH